MKTLREIYAQFRIMPGLQLHQLRVAAVAKLVCESLDEQVDERSVVIAGFFHDMGNILKADLTRFPASLEPRGRAYWEGVKEEFRAQYGEDEHHATSVIAGAIGVPKPSLYLIEHMGFSRASEILKNGSLELQIIEYADQRVAPHGVVSMRERLEEGRQRYAEHPTTGYAHSVEQFEAGTRALEALEARLFSKARILPEDITDTLAAPIIEELWEYPVFV